MAAGVPVNVVKLLQETNASVTTATAALNTDIAAIVPMSGTTVAVINSGVSVLTGPLYTVWATVQYVIAGS